MVRLLDYSAAVQELLAPERVNELGPGQPHRSALDALHTLTPEILVAPHRLRDHDMAQCCLAGLWLLHDYLDEAHRLVQDLDSTSAAYWHGILHRREPDYPNAKYWFRRVGKHPIFAQLTVAAQRIAEMPPAASGAEQGGGRAWPWDKSISVWDPNRFVDACERVAADPELEWARQLCQRLAREESDILFDFCYRAAMGAT